MVMVPAGGAFSVTLFMSHSLVLLQVQQEEASCYLQFTLQPVGVAVLPDRKYITRSTNRKWMTSHVA